MRFLADECFDERLAAALRGAGHDVARVPTRSGLDDLAVAGRAERESRVLLTMDKDFGRIAVDLGRPGTGSSSSVRRLPTSAPWRLAW